MKIAFFTGPLGQPSNTFITNQIIETLTRGHEVHVYSGAPSNYMPGNLMERIPEHLHPKLRVFYLDHQYDPRRFYRLIPYSLRLSQLARDYGISTMRQTCLHIMNFPKESYDVLHAHFGANGRRAAILRRIGYLPNPLITTFHTGRLQRYHKTYPKNYFKIVHEESSVLTVGTQFMRKMLLSTGAPVEKVVKLPMPVNVTDFQYRPPCPGKLLKFITVARLVGWKGHRFAIEALRQFNNINLDWVYTIVGAGIEEARLKEQVAEYGLASKVHFVGAQTSEAVYQLLNEHDILLHPAIEENGVETQGVALIEAAAVGLPIIAFDSGGIPDTVIHEQTGLLLPQRDVDAMVRAMEALRKQPELMQCLSKAAHEHVLRNFNSVEIEAHRMELYHSLLKTGR